ncbi:hypothetical protein QNH28_25005 [Paenibacillus sp. G2S3]|uniref:hypothetical protein n=1 Tax=Paenibacillus sp. G2S3 TaxID=3047872 RepID=UPI0024C19258|nr:hypothetical protein [Paenibacillus sp. G2S3]WHY18684.1 hypothetical protein QNH28_25005 [Paenibacillus sp. G2S3]
MDRVPETPQVDEIHNGLEIRPNSFDCFVDLEEIVVSIEMRVLVLSQFLKWTRIFASSLFQWV